MPVLEIRLFPDPVLRECSKPAAWKDPKVHQFIQSLIITLYDQPGGIGIAAPQVGITKRIILIDVSFKDPTKRLEIMINPKIIHSDGELLSREGCMSLPEYTANIKRSAQVTAQWTDPKGGLQQRRFSGIEAICLQHEIDHLNGKLFIDRVASLKTEVFPRKRRK